MQNTNIIIALVLVGLIPIVYAYLIYKPKVDAVQCNLQSVKDTNAELEITKTALTDRVSSVKQSSQYVTMMANSQAKFVSVADSTLVTSQGIRGLRLTIPWEVQLSGFAGLCTLYGVDGQVLAIDSNKDYISIHSRYGVMQAVPLTPPNPMHIFIVWNNKTAWISAPSLSSHAHTFPRIFYAVKKSDRCALVLATELAINEAAVDHNTINTLFTGIE